MPPREPKSKEHKTPDSDLLLSILEKAAPLSANINAIITITNKGLISNTILVRKMPKNPISANGLTKKQSRTTTAPMIFTERNGKIFLLLSPCLIKSPPKFQFYEFFWIRFLKHFTNSIILY